MAIQTGLYYFKNKLLNVRGFKISSLTPWFVGMLGGASKSQILNNPEFARTRENMSEFGGSSMAGRTYRVGAAQLYSFFYQYLSGFLTQRIVIILHNGPGPRGEREILFTTNPTLIENYDLNPFTTFGSIFSGLFTISSNVARNIGTLFIPSFSPAVFLNAPVGATHFQFVLNVTGMSDWQFTAIVGYNPKNPLANGASGTTFGSILPLNIVAANQTIPATILGTPSMTNATMFTSIGIQFFQQVGPNFYPLFSNNAAKIDQLF